METNIDNILNKPFLINELIGILDKEPTPVSGIYCFYYGNNAIYVGQSIDIERRLKNHIYGAEQYQKLEKDKNIKIVSLKRFLQTMKTQEVGDIAKVVFGSRLLYKFISAHGGIEYFKIRILHISTTGSKEELNRFECDEITKNHTYIGDYKTQYACNLTKGGDNPPIRQNTISNEDANLIRKLAVIEQLGEKSKKREAEFISVISDVLGVNATKSYEDNLILKILRNTSHGGDQYKINSEDELIGFTEEEKEYFRIHENAWTDSNRSFSDNNTHRGTIIKNIKAIDPTSNNIVAEFKSIDDSDELSCERQLKFWLCKHENKTFSSDSIRRWMNTIRTLILKGYIPKGLNSRGEPMIQTTCLKLIWKGDAMKSESLTEEYWNKLDISKALTNQDDCIDKIKSFYGYNGDITTGGFYIMPDGTIIKTQNHTDIDKYLIRAGYISLKDGQKLNELDYGDGSQFMDAINCVRIRRRGGKDSWILPYCVLPNNNLTTTQYNVLEHWLEQVLNKSQEVQISTQTEQSKVYKAWDGYTAQDIIDSIKMFYRSKFLEELGKKPNYDFIFDDLINEDLDNTDYELEKDLSKGYLDQF